MPPYFMTTAFNGIYVLFQERLLFGAFACLEQGMEGFIPRSELPSWVNPLQHLYEGLHLPLRILELDPVRRRLKLSLRQAEPGTG